MTEIDLERQRYLQPTINIGMLGHVSNGKTTITRFISGKDTRQFAEEASTGRTVRLGYANAKIWKSPSLKSPQCYFSSGSDVMEFVCSETGEKCELVAHISFVDCPGHNTLVATMLNGTCVMSTSILIESAEHDIIPAPQTAEHLMATQMIGVPVSFAVLNKADIVSRKRFENKYDKLSDYLKTSEGRDIPIVPISTIHGLNMDIVFEYIACLVKQPTLQLDIAPKMYIVRSFDINRQGTPIDQLVGGVMGGSIQRGYFRVGDKVVIYPGQIRDTIDADKDGSRWKYTPLVTTIQGMMSEKNSLDVAVPGGLIAVRTDMDCSLFRADHLVGNIVTRFGEKIEEEVFETVDIECRPIRLNVDDKMREKYQLKNGDNVIINCNSTNVDGKVTSLETSEGLTVATVQLQESPICAKIGGIISVSKKIPSARLVAQGTIRNGVRCLIYWIV